MDTASQVLLIIVSVTLTLFLLVGIVLAIRLVQILDHVKNITEKAEKIADNAESVSEFFQKTAGPAAITKLVANIVHTLKKKKG
ncbi:MAG TPA: hypothetical protein VJJ78_00915 [Candidatus Saccharimonadales bacterium]|nr:hypothetical protein [Candidatus Saccharimonadales bacterium]